MVFDDLSLGLVKQIFPESRRPDVPATLAKEFARTDLIQKIRPGQRVVVTSGSRGIESMLEVVSSLVRLIRERGAEPVVLPAMGSHGGGTPQGQAEVLAHLGQTEETLGAKILKDYKPKVIGQVFDGLPVSVDAQILKEETDHVILVGRVKEHTEFIGPIESGLLKMAVVGLGRVEGATMMHQAAVTRTYYRTIVEMAKVIFGAAPVLGGVALIEDERNVLKHLEVVPTDKILEREPELLAKSKETRAKLPFDELDVLLVDEMGKNFSGTGIDTKVVGRIMNIYEQEPTTPKITRIVTFKMSPKGGGNAIGIGINDFVTRKLFEAVDPRMTDLNATVAVSPEKGRCPLVREDAAGALAGALATIGPWRSPELKMVWIPNTKDLEYLAVSPKLYLLAKERPGLELIAEPTPLPFLPDQYFEPFAEWLEKRRREVAAKP
ncbi:MAG: DUF362 domain-containing protein [Deltaproteobacteria bacterium]|jgi:hypothetical protein|nr:DUF362 domain-containing protein [Deltaproteobacteria bacterium]